MTNQSSIHSQYMLSNNQPKKLNSIELSWSLILYMYVSNSNISNYFSTQVKIKTNHTFDGVLVIVQTGYVLGAGLG